jgi:hypothetical protein
MLILDLVKTIRGHMDSKHLAMRHGPNHMMYECVDEIIQCLSFSHHCGMDFISQWLMIMR